MLIVSAFVLGVLLGLPDGVVGQLPLGEDAAVAQPIDAADGERPAGEPSPAQRSVLRGAALFLLVGFVLLVVFLVASYAMIRGGRRLREAASRKRRPPTEATDVWAMHKAPVFDEADFEFEPEDRSRDGGDTKAEDNGKD
jgi:hypothetical protein